MARSIDWSKELSDEDRTWAEQRPDMPAGNGMTVAQRIQENDETYGRQAKDAAKSRAERMSDLRTVMADAQNELERLEREEAEEGNPNVAVTGLASQGLIRDNTGVDGQAPEGAPAPEERYADTTAWTKAKLAAEIEERNKERRSLNMEPLSTTGTRAELVERLLKDDEDIEG